jgi:hypothetical protein
VDSGIAFHLDAPIFTAGQAVEISGLTRAVFDMWLQRGFIQTTGRGDKRLPRKKGTGRPYFSAREVFKARLLRVLATDLLLGLTDYMEVAEAALAAETVADTGEWMWSVARSIEKGKPMVVYAYATRSGGEWVFDLHLGKAGEAPRFGWDVPHVYVPMSAVFITVYMACKKIVDASVDHE